MFKSAVLRRLAVIALVVSVMAGVPVFASGGSSADEPAEDAPISSGMLDEVIDWLLGLVDGSSGSESDPNEGDSRGGYDPAG